MRRFATLLLTAACCLGGRVCAQGSSAATAVQEITPAQLATLLSTEAVIVYDCNESETYQEAHVPGALPIVYDEVTPDKLPADHGVPLVFYCYSPECPAGAMAAKTAAELGFTKVYCMTAGIVGWQDAGLDTDP